MSKNQLEDSLIRNRASNNISNYILRFAAILSSFLSIYMLFGVGNFLNTYVLLDTEYLYAMIALLLPLPFVVYHPTPRRGNKIPWYDIIFAASTFIIASYFCYSGSLILEEGWEYLAPTYAKIMAFILWGLVLEASRRAGGNAIFIICLIISIYPAISTFLPGFLSAPAQPWDTTATFHIFGTESIMGIPMTAFATLVVGFLIFGVALQHTGGGSFFLNLAFALLGTRRGGPAKVSIFSSGLMGSMSGSVITNVLTTGVLSIPAMKKTGFKSSYAAGVEACASTGGVLMPPVMGATAFVMATFLEVSYSEIIIAAAFPSILYYFGLFMQIDAYAARNHLKGLPAKELPSIKKVLKEGWYFVFVFVMLILMLLYMQREAQAPYYATATLLIINQIVKIHRWNYKKFLHFIESVGRLFAELAGILVAIGLIIGSLTFTGKIGTITYALVDFAGDSIIILLIMGALTSFILGIGMTVTAAYLFLAVTLAPALTGSGLDKVAVHLFMLYWGMISFITPPVAIGAFAAASVAGANGIRTGVEAMKLGSVIYFIPFFFVLNPALIGRGSVLEIFTVFFSAIAGIILISSSLQGYLVGIGNLKNSRYLEWPIRIMLGFSGILMALPGGDVTGYSNYEINFLAILLFSIPITYLLFLKFQNRFN
ncbi:TRAP transporter fused permease subunit [Alphaproteobacteria bacterium]|nr:TRAP transporter fused permease subunit [Alphaproteobacteria bacterium]